MKNRTIIFLLLCANIFHPLLAQENVNYISHFSEIFANSITNQTKINYNGLDSIVNHNSESPEESVSIIYQKQSLDSIVLSGMVCYAEKIDSDIVVCLRKLPCCDGNIVSYIWCKISNIHNHTIDTLFRMSHTTVTDIPSSYYPSSHIRDFMIEDNCLIRATPRNDNDSIYYELRQKGNTVASLNIGARVYAIAELIKSDSHWLFVAVKIDEFVKESFHEPYDNYTFGWLLDEKKLQESK